MSKKAEYDYLLKILMVGNSGVGKSNLLLRFADDSFTDSHISTIGMDFSVKTVEVDGKTAKLQIWDSAGQERFRTITTAYYRGVMGVLLVYDITNQESFDALKNYHNDFKTHATDTTKLMVIGNKSDEEDYRAISTNHGEDYAKSINASFFEVSAKNNTNIQQSFISMARAIMNGLEGNDDENKEEKKDVEDDVNIILPQVEQNLSLNDRLKDVIIDYQYQPLQQNDNRNKNQLQKWTATEKEKQYGQYQQLVQRLQSQEVCYDLFILLLPIVFMFFLFCCKGESQYGWSTKGDCYCSSDRE